MHHTTLKYNLNTMSNSTNISNARALIPKDLRGYNVSSWRFQWQILGRVKQISIFCKVGSCKVTSWHTCYIFIFSKFQCEKYLKINLEI